MAGLFINNSFKVVASLISLWGIALLTCIQNVGALRMLGECSIRCHLKLWSLGHHDIERCEMEPENAASFVLLSNIYAAVGNIHLCENVEHQRKEKGAKKCSHLD